MYKRIRPSHTSLRVNETVEGETIEQKVDRILNNKEPINDTAPTIYTERKDGVMPAYNIRTDRWEIAINAMDYVSKSREAKRMDAIKMREEDGKPEPIQGDATSE